MPTADELWYLQQQNQNNRLAGLSAQQQQQYAQGQQQQNFAQQYWQWLQQQQLSQEYQKKSDQANQKNEDRYLDILSGRLGTRDRVLADLNSWGKSQITDAGDRNKILQSQMEGNIYSRGFGGSPSMLNSASRSANTALGREVGRINDDIINRRTQADASQSDSLFNFMERRNDVPPDLNQLIALQQGLGRSGPYLSAPGGVPPGSPVLYGQGQLAATGQPTSFETTQSLPGTAQNYAGTPYGPRAAQMSGQPANRNEPSPDLGRRNSMASLQQAYNSGGGIGSQQRINEAQNRAISGGYADWQPGQSMPLIPGMAGGAMGAGGLLPSLPSGGYGSGYSGPSYPRQLNPYGQNYWGNYGQQPQRDPAPARRRQYNFIGDINTPTNFAYA